MAWFNLEGDILQGILFRSGVFKGHISVEEHQLLIVQEMHAVAYPPKFNRYSVIQHLLILREWLSSIHHFVRYVFNFIQPAYTGQLFGHVARLIQKTQDRTSK